MPASPRDKSLIICLASGAVLGALSVIGGELFEWRRFSAREGYLGTGFLDDWLYAIGDTSLHWWL